MWQLLRWREYCGFYGEEVINERIDILVIFGFLF
jgi:hypothetical protein